ncbi:MAG: NADH-quinone oxidoreductase subunit J [Bacteroidetes bacterium]|nr:NADH-quinone oxidoreductase subunit J [Bacteroidota bacterium]MBR3090660.1 NADH-quinone oxidoreductase subunit J [Bacteroidota bacterium]
MGITSILFIILAILAIISALITVFNKQPIKSAIALIFHFFMLAGIYLTLAAQFLAVMQILVYAGAIMVLVIFVIMLLNQNDEELHEQNKQIKRKLFSVVLSGIFLFLMVMFIIGGKQSNLYDGQISSNIGTVQTLAKELYSNFLVPVEITGILLLATIVGAVLMAKKRLN